MLEIYKQQLKKMNHNIPKLLGEPLTDNLIDKLKHKELK